MGDVVEIPTELNAQAATLPEVPDLESFIVGEAAGKMAGELITALGKWLDYMQAHHAMMSDPDTSDEHYEQGQRNYTVQMTRAGIAVSTLLGEKQ